MEVKKEYQRQELLAYLEEYSYQMTYRKNIYDGFFHWRTYKHLYVPYTQQNFSESEILVIFEKGDATELGLNLEYCRLQLFVHYFRMKN